METSTQVIDSITWTMGRHTIKTGIDFQTTGFQITSALSRAYSFGGLSAAAENLR